MNRKWIFPILAIIVISILAGCVPKVEESSAISTPSIVTSEVQKEALPTPVPIPTENFFPVSLSGKIPVIFSHGGGPCDIGALVFLSKHPNIDLIGLVLSNGEFHPTKAMDEWPVFLYDILDYDSAALGLGTETPLDPDGHGFPEEWRSGADDFWGLDLPVRSTTYPAEIGHELIIRLIKNSPQKVTILIMGGQADLALAIQQEPSIVENIANIVIMGGAFKMPGNLHEGPEETSNEAAEWNMYIDPLAAKIVFNSGAPISIVPLDAIQYLVNSKNLNEINTINDPGVKYIAQMWNKQWGWSNSTGFLIWDTITATAITNPEYFNWVYDGVDVITAPGDFQGQTIALNNGAELTRFAVGADYNAVLDQLFETFREETTAIEPNTLITELAGTWEGFTGGFHITFFLAPECKLNEKCGTFEIPEFSLTGDIAFVNKDGNVYEFKTTHTSSGQPGNDYEYLQLLDDGTLKYYTEGADEACEAILYSK